MSMMFRTASAFAAPMLLATLVSAAAQAAAPSASPATAPFAGPSIPGVCLLAQEAVFANAKVGQAATARLRELAQTAQSGLEPEGKALADDAKALEAQKASLKPGEFQQRQQALAQRAQALQAKAAQLSQQVEATRQKALQRISQDEQPVVAAAYKAHGCGVLFARSAVLAGGAEMDLTPAVVQGLDAKISTITFDLEPLPAPAQAQTSAKSQGR